MKTDKITLDIIRIIANSNGCISSYKIAEEIGISRRSIRDKMKDVKAVLKSIGFELDSLVSRGYRIVYNNKSQDDLFNCLSALEKTKEVMLPQTAKERQNYIILKLLRSKTYIKIDDLAEELASSRTTISNDLKVIRDDYRHRAVLNYKQKPRFGIKFELDEMVARNLYIDTLFQQFTSEKTFYDYLNISINPKNNLDYQIYNLINEHFGLSDLALMDFYFYISTATLRISMGYELKESMDLGTYRDHVEYQIAHDISKLIEHELDTTFNKFEINQLCIELISRRASFSRTLQSNREYDNVFYDVCERIDTETQIDFSKDDSLKELFTAYLPTLYFRLHYNTKLRTPLYLSATNRYPLAYECSRIAAKYFEQKYNCRMSSSEMVTMAIFFQNSILEMGYFKKKVYVVCGLGRGATEMIRHQLNMWFNQEIEVVKAAQYYIFKEEDLSDVDFVISMTPIHQDLPIPKLIISQMFDEDDKMRIRSFLDYNYNIPYIQLAFNPRLYYRNVSHKTKNTLLKHLTNVISESYPSVDKAVFSPIIMDKKRQTVYEFDCGVTLVQFEFSINAGPMIAVFQLKNEIQWNSKPARTLIFASLRPEKKLIIESIRSTLSNIHEPFNHANLEYRDFIAYLKEYQIKEKGNQKIIYDIIP